MKLKQFKKEAKKYQKMSVIRDEIKETIIEAFFDVIDFDCDNGYAEFCFCDYTEALK